MMGQILNNSWENIVDFYVECAEHDVEIRKMLNYCRSIAIEKKITIYDAIFIVAYGNATVNDKKFYRKLN